MLNMCLSIKEGKTIFHNIGGLFGFAEDILIGGVENTNALRRFGEILNSFYWQALGDLKSSFLLAFCGRYRQAFIVMRSALELLTYGLYFQLKMWAEEPLDDWKDWWNGKLRWSRVVKYLEDKNLLSKGEAKRLMKLYYETLSKTVHTTSRGSVMRTIEGKSELIRPASSHIDLDELKEWFNCLLECFRQFHSFLSASNLTVERSRRAYSNLKKLLEILQNQHRKNQYKPVSFVECNILEQNRK